MSFLERARPADDVALRRAVYDGAVFLLPANADSRALVEVADALRRDAFGDEPRTAHAQVTDEELFARVGRIRRELYFDPRARSLAKDIAATVGFSHDFTALDPARLRVVAHGACDNPRAAPAYFPHRDTWYGHPRSVVTLWISLDDLGAGETFVFYPAHFRAPVDNDSDAFDYDAWTAEGPGLKIGWQDRDASSRARYPGVRGEEDFGAPEGFACRRGEILVFSGAHLHRTLPQRGGLTRFSLDARVVHLDDERDGLGAPNVDGRARGSALRDYVHPHGGARA